MNSSESDKSLSRVLAGWRLQPRRDPQFRPSVQARIMTGTGTDRDNAGLFRLQSIWLAGALAVAVMVGAWGGREEARRRTELDRTAMAAAYVRGLDARQMRMP